MYITRKQIAKLGQSSDKILAALSMVDENHPIMLEKIVDLLDNDNINLLIMHSDANPELVQHYFLKITSIIEHLLSEKSADALNVLKTYARGDATIKMVGEAVVCSMRESFKYPIKSMPLPLNAETHDEKKWQQYYATSARANAIYAVHLLARIFVKLVGDHHFKDAETNDVVTHPAFLESAFSSIAQVVAQAQAFEIVKNFTHLGSVARTDIYLNAINSCLNDQLAYVNMFLPLANEPIKTI